MPARGRSLLRFARPPRWVTALGLVLVLGELGAGAALLAAGHGGTGHQHAARARPHATSSPTAAVSPTGGVSPTVTASPGPLRTVVLRVDGTGCEPVSRCRDDAMQVMYVPPTGRYKWSYPHSLPFSETVRVPTGELVKFNAYPGSQAWATCTITVDGTMLSQVTTRTLGGIASCRSVVPPAVTNRSAATRKVLLEVDNAYSKDTATYGTPTVEGQFDESAGMPAPDGRGYWKQPYRFTKTVEVRPGGSVTIRTLTGYIGKFTPSCSISADGQVLSQVVVEGTWSKGTCRATIP